MALVSQVLNTGRKCITTALMLVKSGKKFLKSNDITLYSKLVGASLLEGSIGNKIVGKISLQELA